MILNESSSNTSNFASNETKFLPLQIHRSLIIPRIIIYVFIGCFILVGNAFCLVVFLRTKSLRRRSYDLLISLSIADLLVGFSSILICVEDGLALQNKRNSNLPILRDVSQYFPRMCSLFTVASVAVERFWAVGFPTKHRAAGKGPYILLIAIPWVMSLWLSLLYLSSTLSLTSFSLFNYIDVVFSQLTLLTIIIAYCGLMFKMKTNSTRSRQPRRILKERKLAVTLFAVTLASLITIYPVNIYFVIQIFHEGHDFEISANVFLFLIALASCNSGVNVVVYMFRIKEFQRVVFRMLGRHGPRVSCSTRSRNEGFPSQNNSSLVNSN